MLRAADYRVAVNPGLASAPYRSVFEDYRYDALGRRIWVRTRRWCTGIFDGTNKYPRNGECRVSSVRRTIWDGEQELGEIQMPDASGTLAWEMENDTGALPQQSKLDSADYQNDPNVFFGRVAYTSGLALDQPLAVTRMGYAAGYLVDIPNMPLTQLNDETVVPQWNSQGQPEVGAFADGATRHCKAVAGTTNSYCYGLEWPSGWYPYNRRFFIRQVWHGTLLEDKADKAQTLYRRNRSYDPAIGRFTQEDPIGLAGGLNSYGFANGDPVNYADPFGLKPCSMNPFAWTCTWADIKENFSQWWHMNDSNFGSEFRRGSQMAAMSLPAAAKGVALFRGMAAREAAINVPGPVNSAYGKVDYLLGNVPGNQASAGKGGFFRGVLGFDEETMAPALRSHVLGNFEGGVLNKAGNFEVTGTMIGANGRSATVTTVWRPGENGTMNFVTAVPR